MSISPSAGPESQWRMVPRYAVVAKSEIADSANAVQFSGRVIEISRNGCFVYISTPFSVGTLLDMRIYGDQGTIATKGKVIYAHEGLGFGVTFLSPTEEQLTILDSWLAQLSSVIPVEKTGD